MNSDHAPFSLPTFTDSYSTEISSMPVASPPAVLGELVQHFHVSWMITPVTLVIDATRRQDEFVLELHAFHEHGEEHPVRSCGRCQNAYGALRAIADWILPCDRRSSACKIELHSPFLTADPKGESRTVVKLAIWVTHNEENKRCTRSYGSRCLQVVERRLKVLGATEAGVRIHPMARAARSIGS